MSDQGRRRSASDLEGPIKKRGRPAKNANTSQNHIARRWAKSLLGRNDPIEDSDLARLLAHPPDEQWSVQDENRITQKWEESEEKRAIDKIKPNSHPHVLKWWKTCLRVFRITPVELISPLNNLRYIPMTDGDVTARHLYNKDFCDILMPIVVHPFILGNRARLLVVLQFAAICRIDDREVWRSGVKIRGSCPAINETNRLIKEDIHNGISKSLDSVHGIARLNVESQEQTPSNLSDFLHHLGRIVLGKIYRLPIVPDDFSPYMGKLVLPFCEIDVKNIQQAIDTMEWRHEEYECTTEEAWQSYNARSQIHGLPRGRNLAATFESAQKVLLRKIDEQGPSRARQVSHSSIEGQSLNEGAVAPEGLIVASSPYAESYLEEAHGSTEAILQEMRDIKAQFQVFREERTQEIKILKEQHNAAIDALKSQFETETGALKAQIHAVLDENSRLAQQSRSRGVSASGATDNEDQDEPERLDISEATIEWLSG
ncbi:hypothetical protein FSST1_010522 [Fusarium sambucinum]